MPIRSGPGQLVAALGGDRPPRLLKAARREMMGLVNGARHLRIGLAVAREQPRGLELQRERRQGVGEYVVHLTGHPASLRGGRGAGLGSARGLELVAVFTDPADQPHHEEPRHRADQDRHRRGRLALDRRDHEEHDDGRREGDRARAAIETERRHDPDEVRSRRPDPVRLHDR